MNTKIYRDCAEVLFLLALLAALLIVFQYATVTALGALAPSVTFISLPEYAVEIQQHVEFSWYDAVLAVAIVTTALTLTLREIWGRKLSHFCSLVFASEKKTLCFLVLAGIVSTRFYLTPGVFSWAADQAQHISFSHITAFALANGEMPIWTNYLGCGTPYLQFYGFLFFYAVGFVDLLLGEIYSSLKVVLFVGHVASGITMYLFVRAASHSRRAGIVAGLAYVLSFWHTQQVLIMGRFPLSLFYALMPLAFYFAERTLSRRTGAANMLFGGISLGLLAFIHPGYSVWATLLLGIYSFFRLTKRPPQQSIIASLGRISILFVVGLTFGSYLTLPMWLEQEFTGLHRGISFANVADPSWRHVFVWSNFRFWLLPLPLDQVHWYGGYVGLSLVVITAAGGAVGFRHRSKLSFRTDIAIWTCLAVASLLVFGYRLAPIRMLPLVDILGSGRYLLFFVFTLSAAAGMAAKKLLSVQANNAMRYRTVAVLLLAIGWDLLPTTIQHPYGTTHNDKDAWGNDLGEYGALRKRANELAEKGLLPNARVYWAWDDHHPYLAEGQLYYNTRTAMPHAHHPGDVRAVHDFVKPLQQFLNIALTDMPQRRADIFKADDISLINGAIVMLNAKFVFASQKDKSTIGMKWPYNTPLLVSPKLTPYTERDSTEWTQNKQLVPTRLQTALSTPSAEVMSAVEIVKRTGVGFLENRCEQILVRNLASDLDLGTNPTLELINHTERNQRVEMAVKLSSKAFVRLAYSYFPHLRITVDGEEIIPFQTAGRFIALKLDRGNHVITLEPHLSGLRRILLILDIAILMAAVYCYARERLHHPLIQKV